VFDDKTGKFFIQDIGSTNGTYMLLCGPNSGPYRLHLNDHILVGRTGFSVNRYDYGISEEIGFRQTMEDACVIVQDLNVLPLCAHTNQYMPQSFFGVFDGHGGPNASKYLSKHLHVNVADGLAAATPDILQLLEYHTKDAGASTVDESINNILINMMKSIYVQTDKNFIETSEFRDHGSTATTVLIVGQRLFCANVGDSRSVLCR
jgi:serine/threonine protein phosphatase PrpC